MNDKCEYPGGCCCPAGAHDEKPHDDTAERLTDAEAKRIQNAIHLAKLEKAVDELAVRLSETSRLTRAEVYALIDGERAYQDGLDLTRTDGSAKGVGDYLTLLRTYLREAEEGWTRSAGNEKGLNSIRKIAAIAVKCMEQHGAPSRQ